MTWLYLMKNKHDVLPLSRTFHKMIKTQFSADVKILRSDNGGEYVNREFQAYCQLHGIKHESTCPYTPQQNGVAERRNCHILETTRALLDASHASKQYWVDAVVTAIYLLNRMPSRILNFETPLQVLGHYKPLLSVITLSPKVFGCVAYVHVHKHQRTKLDPCAIKCVFLGYGID